MWLGPCIGRDAFEVGPEVVDAFVSRNAHWGRYFKSVSDSDRSMADLRGIACDLLENLGVVILKGSMRAHTATRRGGIPIVAQV